MHQIETEKELALWNLRIALRHLLTAVQVADAVWEEACEIRSINQSSVHIKAKECRDLRDEVQVLYQTIKRFNPNFEHRLCDSNGIPKYNPPYEYGVSKS